MKKEKSFTSEREELKKGPIIWVWVSVNFVKKPFSGLERNPFKWNQ